MIFDGRFLLEICEEINGLPLCFTRLFRSPAIVALHRPPKGNGCQSSRPICCGKRKPTHIEKKLETMQSLDQRNVFEEPDGPFTVPIVV